MDEIFKVVSNKINEENLSQRKCYIFPKADELDQLKNVFVFNLQTYNGQKYAKAYASGLFDVRSFCQVRNRHLTGKIDAENEKVVVFGTSDGNPVKNMNKYVSKNYEEHEKKYTDGDVDEKFSLYRLYILAHNASGFDDWVVLNLIA